MKKTYCVLYLFGTITINCIGMSRSALPTQYEISLPSRYHSIIRLSQEYPDLQATLIAQATLEIGIPPTYELFFIGSQTAEEAFFNTCTEKTEQALFEKLAQELNNQEVRKTIVQKIKSLKLNPDKT